MVLNKKLPLSETPVKETFIGQKAVVILLFFIVILLAGFLSLLPFQTTSAYYLFKSIQLLVFLIMGLIICNRFKKEKESKKNTLMQLLFKVAMPGALMIFIELNIVYYFFERNIWLMAISSAAAFLIPFFMNISWNLLLLIPVKKFTLWIPNKSVESGASIFLDSINVRLKLAKKLEDLHEQTFAINIPGYIKLGDFFTRFLYAQNKKAETAIEDTDRKKNRYAWEFFATDRYGLQQRRLDPDMNINQNKIKQAAYIRAKRVYEPLKLLTTTQSIINENV